MSARHREQSWRLLTFRAGPAVQLARPDGRVDLADPAAIAGSRFAHADLAPVPVSGRTRTTCNYFALWIGKSHNLATYALAASRIAVGMSAWRGPAHHAGLDSRPRAVHVVSPSCDFSNLAPRVIAAVAPGSRPRRLKVTPPLGMPATMERE